MLDTLAVQPCAARTREQSNAQSNVQIHPYSMQRHSSVENHVAFCFFCVW